MTDIDKIVLTALGALVVYVVGQLVLKFFIEPVHDLRKTVGEVRFHLLYFGSTIHTPSERTREAATAAEDALLKCSCELLAKLYAVPCYDRSRLLSFGVLPPRKSIEEAAVRIRGLSTYLCQTGEGADQSIESVSQRIIAIKRLLQLRPLAGEE